MFETNAMINSKAFYKPYKHLPVMFISMHVCNIVALLVGCLHITNSRSVQTDVVDIRKTHPMLASLYKTAKSVQEKNKKTVDRLKNMLPVFPDELPLLNLPGSLNKHIKRSPVNFKHFEKQRQNRREPPVYFQPIHPDILPLPPPPLDSFLPPPDVAPLPSPYMDIISSFLPKACRRRRRNKRVEDFREEKVRRRLCRWLRRKAKSRFRMKQRKVVKDDSKEIALQIAPTVLQDVSQHSVAESTKPLVYNNVPAQVISVSKKVPENKADLQVTTTNISDNTRLSNASFQNNTSNIESTLRNNTLTVVPEVTPTLSDMTHSVSRTTIAPAVHSVKINTTENIDSHQTAVEELQLITNYTEEFAADVIMNISTNASNNTTEERKLSMSINRQLAQYIIYNF